MHVFPFNNVNFLNVATVLQKLWGVVFKPLSRKAPGSESQARDQVRTWIQISGINMLKVWECQKLQHAKPLCRA